MANWLTGEVLGLDFETTGIDRFNDVPVSYALVSVVEGVVVQELVRAHRPRPGDPAGGDRGARHLDGAGAGRGHAAPGGDRAGLRRRGGRGRPTGRPAGRDEARLRPDHPGDAGPRPLSVRARSSGAGAGPVLDAVVHRPPLRSRPQGQAHAGRPVRALRRSTSGTPTMRRRTPSPPSRCSSPSPCATRSCGSAISTALHHDQIDWHREWTESYDTWRARRGDDPHRPPRLLVAGRRRRCCRQPEADQVLSRSQTMSTPSFSARTTLAGCCLSMWPTRPL